MSEKLIYLKDDEFETILRLDVVSTSCKADVIPDDVDLTTGIISSSLILLLPDLSLYCSIPIFLLLIFVYKAYHAEFVQMYQISSFSIHSSRIVFCRYCVTGIPFLGFDICTRSILATVENV